MVAKKPFLFIALCLITCILFTCCSKSNDNSGSGSSFTATVNGKSFVPTVAGGQDVTSGNFFYLAGSLVSSTDTVIFSITLPDTLVVNTPMVFDGLNTFMAYEDLKTGVTYSNEGFAQAPGSLTITYLNTQNTQITGIFAGTLYNQSNANDSIVVANGKFNILYTSD